MTEEVNRDNTRENSSGSGVQPEHKASEFAQIIAAKESEIAALRKSESELEEKVSALSKSLADAVTSYKSRVIQINPGITEELISGETIEAVNASLEKAVNLISRVKKSVENEISRTKVPAGAPGRTSIDLSTLSSREKIQYAVGGKK